MNSNDDTDEQRSPLKTSITVIGIAISLLHLYFNLFTVLPTLWQNALHFSGFALLCGLLYPLRGEALEERSPGWLALGLATGSIIPVMIGLASLVLVMGLPVTRLTLLFLAFLLIKPSAVIIHGAAAL